MIVERELVFFEKEIKTQNELFNFMFDKLLEKNYVTKEYLPKIIEREKNYPTGLQLEKINVAIPHTDPNCSNTNKIFIIKLKNPVKFINAETGEEIGINLILGLIFKNGDNQIDILKKIGEFLQEEKYQDEILACQEQEKFYKVMEKLFT